MSLRRFAVVTASCTFLLLLMGGLVHNTALVAGVPRLAALLRAGVPEDGGRRARRAQPSAGRRDGDVLAFALMIGCWRRATRGVTRASAKAGVLAFALVLVQALLGGITVIFRLPTMVSTAHLAVSLLFFLTLIYMAFRAGAETAARPAGARCSA